MKRSIELGMKVKDKITGLTGIVTSKVEYLYGCNQYGVTSQSTDNKAGEINYFDEGRVEYLEDGINPMDVRVLKNGAERNDCPRK